MSKEKDNAIANNKKASHLYFIEDTYEAGIELFGTEVKSIRAGQVNIKDSYCDKIRARSSSTVCTSLPMSREIYTMLTP